MTKQEGGAMNEKIAPILSIEYGTAAHIKNVLSYSAFLVAVTLCAVGVLIFGYEEVIAAGGGSLNLPVSLLIKLGAGVTPFVCIPVIIRSMLTIGDIYFFNDLVCIRRFFFPKKVRRLRYVDIEFHRLINWQWRIEMLAFPYKGKNPLSRFYKYITMRSSIVIKNKANVEKVLSFLASKNIDTIANNYPNLPKIFFGISH